MATVLVYIFGLSIFFLPLLVSAESYGNPLKYDDFTALITDVLKALQTIVATLALIFLIVGALIYLTSAGNEKLLTLGKSAILAAAIGLAIAIAAPLFLREIGLMLGWVTPTELSGVGTSLTLSQVLANVLSFLLSLLGVVAMIALVIGGFLYLTSAGDADRADTGKNILKYSIIGLIVALAGLVIVTQVAKFFE